VTEEPAAAAPAAAARRTKPGRTLPTLPDGPVEVRHRRAPRYGRFITAGLFVGALASFTLAIVTRGWSGLSASNTFWLLLLSLGVAGMVAGAAVAYALDQRSLAAMARQTAPATRPAAPATRPAAPATRPATDAAPATRPATDSPPPAEETP